LTRPGTNRHLAAVSRVVTTWTPEQARAWGVKGREARAKRLALRRQLSAGLAVLPETAPWEQTLLSRVRAQASRMLDLMDVESTKASPDGQRLNWLASALERLAELDRVLSGRPLPGSRRPAPERASEARASAMHRPPIEPRPLPAPGPAANGAQDEPPPAASLLSEPPDW